MPKLRRQEESKVSEEENNYYLLGMQSSLVLDTYNMTNDSASVALPACLMAPIFLFLFSHRHC